MPQSGPARASVTFRCSPRSAPFGLAGARVTVSLIFAIALGLVACGSGEDDPAREPPPDTGAPRPRGDARGDAGAKECASRKEVEGPFSRDLVALCLEFSAKDEAGEAACKASKWDCRFHAELVRALAEREDLDDEASKEGASGGKFEKVMTHILRWEGGCSDHPADNGGRTFKGITTARARENGWSGDVCDMPTKRVFAIYREDYWAPRAKAQPWPLDLAVMNTEVNSGGGKSREFLERMRARGVGGSAREKARWFVDQQTAFYRDIVARNPGQGVFLQGWLNRSAYMQDVVAGRTPTAAFAWTGLSAWPAPAAAAPRGTGTRSVARAGARGGGSGGGSGGNVPLAFPYGAVPLSFDTGALGSAWPSLVDGSAKAFR